MICHMSIHITAEEHLLLRGGRDGGMIPWLILCPVAPSP